MVTLEIPNSKLKSSLSNFFSSRIEILNEENGVRSRFKWIFIQAAFNRTENDTFFLLYKYFLSVDLRVRLDVCVCVLVFGTRWLSVRQHINTLSMIWRVRTVFFHSDIVATLFDVWLCSRPYSDPNSIPLHPVHDRTRKVTMRLLRIYTIFDLAIERGARASETERETKK